MNERTNTSVEEVRSMLDDPLRLHLMGVGGAGMKGLAHLLSNEGHRVTGCDSKEEKARRVERKYQIETYPGHDPSHLDGSERGEIDLLIHSAAVPESNPERTYARKRRIPEVSYSLGLAALFNKKTGIGVAGTHGKTTCSAMLSVVLATAGFDPSCLVGGVLQQWGRGSRVGDGAHFVAEACEFGQNFRAMRPNHILLTNIDRAHLDYYDSADAIEEAFAAFVHRQNQAGFLVSEGTAGAVERVCKRASSKVHRIDRRDESEWRLESRESGEKRVFRVTKGNDASPELPVPIEGRHQVMNAAQVSVLARLLGADWARIQEGLERFEGVQRRFEIHRDGTEGGPVVIDDYGHHPEEIQRTVSAVRTSYPKRYLVVCFQPHQYSRTYHFRDEWGDALSDADEVWLTPIYEARDTERTRNRISIDDLARRVRASQRKTRVVDGPREAGKKMVEKDSSERVYLTIGAGDIWKAVEVFTSHLPEKEKP